MTTIKKGTHGVLTNTNSGVTIPGTIRQSWEENDNYVLKIDGDDTALGSNIFPVEAGWTFEPDKQPIPTKTGAVIEITRWAGEDFNGPAWRALLTKGGWRVAGDYDKRYSTDEFKDRFIEQSEGYAFEVVL